MKVEAVGFKDQKALQFNKVENSVDFEAVLEGISENMVNLNICQVGENNQDEITGDDNISLDVLQANLNGFILNLYKNMDSNLLNFNFKTNDNDNVLEETILNQWQSLKNIFVETNNISKEIVSEKDKLSIALNELFKIPEDERTSIDFSKIEDLLNTQKLKLHLNKDVAENEGENLLSLLLNSKLSEDNVEQNINNDFKNVNQIVQQSVKKEDFTENVTIETSKDNVYQTKNDLLQNIADTRSYGDFKKQYTIDYDLDYDFIKHITNESIPQDKININIKDLKAEIEKVIPSSKAEEIVDIAIQKFKSIRLPDLTEVRVKLKPEDLGEITIKVVLEKGEIKGSITVEKREVALILQNSVENIKQELKNNNVNISNITVYLSNDGLGSGSNREFNQFKNNRPKNLELEFDEDVKEEDGLNIYA
ncbi:hook-length control protein FliK [Caloramator fervidus]|uniref:Hook-length control protein FliK n=1 Tax=Caloramator fervidus TaxID=29344 RepID=A0A1H5SCK6_9CLOT|nr:flagellar hook-length control protein FliK [Caloramator fervidus]SEF48302.1 hook-length control protein FliK [Caloramator fervidus]